MPRVGAAVCSRMWGGSCIIMLNGGGGQLYDNAKTGWFSMSRMTPSRVVSTVFFDGRREVRLFVSSSLLPPGSIVFPARYVSSPPSCSTVGALFASVFNGPCRLRRLVRLLYHWTGVFCGAGFFSTASGTNASASCSKCAAGTFFTGSGAPTAAFCYGTTFHTALVRTRIGLE